MTASILQPSVPSGKAFNEVEACITTRWNEKIVETKQYKLKWDASNDDSIASDALYQNLVELQEKLERLSTLIPEGMNGTSSMQDLEVGVVDFNDFINSHDNELLPSDDTRTASDSFTPALQKVELCNITERDEEIEEVKEYGFGKDASHEDDKIIEAKEYKPKGDTFDDNDEIVSGDLGIFDEGSTSNVTVKENGPNRMMRLTLFELNGEPIRDVLSSQKDQTSTAPVKNIADESSPASAIDTDHDASQPLFEHMTSFITSQDDQSCREDKCWAQSGGNCDDRLTSEQDLPCDAESDDSSGPYQPQFSSCYSVAGNSETGSSDDCGSGSGGSSGQYQPQFSSCYSVAGNSENGSSDDCASESDDSSGPYQPQFSSCYSVAGNSETGSSVDCGSGSDGSSGSYQPRFSSCYSVARNSETGSNDDCGSGYIVIYDSDYDLDQEHGSDSHNAGGEIKTLDSDYELECEDESEVITVSGEIITVPSDKGPEGEKVSECEWETRKPREDGRSEVDSTEKASNFKELQLTSREKVEKWLATLPIDLERQDVVAQPNA